jgi:hypothetical protein
MGLKVIMTWDIAPEKEREYFEFVVRDFIPGLQRLGFELNDAWATVYGKHPQILIGATLPDMPKVKKVLVSDEWKKLHDQLLGFVLNFTLKVVEAREGFQF